MNQKKSRLVLALAEGRSFYIGDQKYTVETIHSAGWVTLSTDRSWCIERIDLFGSLRQEVEPGVNLSLGKGSIGMVKIVCEAPRSVVIDRDERRGVS